MNKKALNHTIAKAVRVEYEPRTDTVYLVFEIVDEGFKQKVKQDWTQDLELEVIGRRLVESEE